MTTLHTGDCRNVLKDYADGAFTACVTDPPYGLGFMGKGWDHGVPGADFWREVLRVLKPGAPLLAFGGTRTYHRLVCAIEDAGFEIRDCLMWLYGCLDEKTEVATADGIKPHHKTKAGDLVLCYDPETGEYSYQPVLEVVEYEYEDTAYRLVGDFGEQVVSRNHRCIVERDGREVFQFAETLERQARVPILESLPALRKALSGAQSNASHPQQNLRPGMCEGDDCDSAQRGEAPGDAFGEGATDMFSLRGGFLSEQETRGEGEHCNLFEAVQRDLARTGPDGTRAQGPRKLGTRSGEYIATAHDRPRQPLLERRADVSQPKGRVREPADQICALPAGIPEHGQKGRVCDGAQVDGGDGDGSGADAGGDCASYESRRHGQSAGEPYAIRNERATQGVRAWRGHRTSVVRVVPFHYVGKVWCLRVPTGAFVAVRNGVAFPTGNSGFPKSLDIGKALDKAAGAKREVVGIDPTRAGRLVNQTDAYTTEAGWSAGGRDIHLTAPATDAARLWDGWGTALKPGWEPIVLAMKPLDGTFAHNALAHGVAGLNVDGCRLETDERLQGSSVRSDIRGGAYGGGHRAHPSLPSYVQSSAGRWPPNVMLDEDAAAMLDGQTGERAAGARPAWRGGSMGYGGDRPDATRGERVVLDAGGASRFFYCPKASPADRSAGGTVDNRHPTVKPHNLMRWLCRLVKMPEGSVILDPFMGSGSTGCAAAVEGIDFVGIDLDPAHVEIARQRIEALNAEHQPSLF